MIIDVYCVTSGNVKVQKQRGEKELILSFANDGAIMGHRGISGSMSTYCISVTAQETTELCFLAIEFFKTMINVNQTFAYNLLMFYTDELHSSEKKMHNLALMSVKVRLAIAILERRDQFGFNPEGFLNLVLIRQDLAAFTGETY